LSPLQIRSSKYKALNRDVGKAVHRYEMLQDGDRIVVGLSGGADSLTMMWMLSERLARISINYELFAVHIDPGFEGGFSESLETYCENKGFALRVEHTDYAPGCAENVSLKLPMNWPAINWPWGTTKMISSRRFF
jgi:tRNA 2-thiocytidine biosynthesis protein TtcA